MAKVPLATETSFILAEDGAADTIRPRLEAASANLDRVHLIEAVNDHIGPRPFNLVVDMDRLERWLLGVRKPRLVIIDPINACFNSTDFHRFNPSSVQHVRALLGRLEALAAKYRVAVTHFTKAKGGSALSRVAGSIAFAAVARSVFTVTRKQDDPDVQFLRRQKIISGGTSMRSHFVLSNGSRPTISPPPARYSPEANFDHKRVVSWHLEIVAPSTVSLRKQALSQRPSRLARVAAPRCHDGKCSCAAGQWCRHAAASAIRDGVKDATTDRTIIKAWWNRWPNANIGVATGRRSGILVLDVDGKVGKAYLEKLQAEHGRLPKTVTVKTGRGRHRYFLSGDARIRNSVGQPWQRN